MQESYKNYKNKLLIPILIIIILIILILTLTSCDKTIFNISTELNNNFSGTRTIDIAVKTEYIRRGEVALGDEKSLFEKIFESLPQGDLDTIEKDGYTHFISKIAFDDINFLQHVSIDNFSENPPERFYAKIEQKDSFFYTQYNFEDFVDMKIDESVIKSGGVNSDFYRLDSILGADSDILDVVYQVKFPFKILKSNADTIDTKNNIAIWNLKYGEQQNIIVDGKKVKFLPYFLLSILGIILLVCLFIGISIAFSSAKRKREIKRTKPLYSYDNYFKKDKKDKY